MGRIRVDATRILAREEILAVLGDLRRRAGRSVNTFQNLIIFRLSCCCGLRRKEIIGLNVGDVALSGPRPFIRVRKDITKGQEGKRRARKVPLWWDAGTKADIESWVAFRLKTADLNAPLICSFYGKNNGTTGRRLVKSVVSRRWQTALKVLGPGRAEQLSIHCGRHSFCSHAIAAGHSLTEVRDAAGHDGIETTNIYLHSLERTGVPDMFPLKGLKR